MDEFRRQRQDDCDGDPMTLDLHGSTYDQAQREMIRFVELWFGTEELLTVVTGNSARMKELVIRILGEYQLRYDDKYCNNGSIVFET